MSEYSRRSFGFPVILVQEGGIYLLPRQFACHELAHSTANLPLGVLVEIRMEWYAQHIRRRLLRNGTSALHRRAVLVGLELVHWQQVVDSTLDAKFPQVLLQGNPVVQAYGIGCPSVVES